MLQRDESNRQRGPIHGLMKLMTTQKLQFCGRSHLLDHDRSAFDRIGAVYMVWIAIHVKQAGIACLGRCSPRKDQRHCLWLHQIAATGVLAHGSRVFMMNNTQLQVLHPDNIPSLAVDGRGSRVTRQVCVRVDSSGERLHWSRSRAPSTQLRQPGHAPQLSAAW